MERHTMIGTRAGLGRRCAPLAVSAMIVGAVVLAGGQSAAATASTPPPAQPAAVTLPQALQADPYTDSGPQHATAVEPDVAANGQTVVTAYQVGRFNSGGSAENMAWATSTDGGGTWTDGTLQGFTQAAGGPWPRVVDQSIAYDTTHHTWLLGALGVGPLNGQQIEQELLVTRSADGLHWSAPISVDHTSEPDKEWLVCDNGASSPYAGTCYAVYQNQKVQDRFQVRRSTDGGLTWSAPVGTPSNAVGYNVQPVVQPDGTLVVVATDLAATQILAFRSKDGGASLTDPVVVSDIQKRSVPLMRALRKPSVGVDAAGKVYAVWWDCRFRASCSSDDLVLTTSTDGLSWSPLAAIGGSSWMAGTDNFLPGLGVDATTSGSTASLGVVFHYYDQPVCGSTGQPACQLEVGYVSSEDGGQTWDPPVKLTASPENPNWLPTSYQGHMVGDYFSTAFVDGHAITVFPLASAKTGASFNQSMYAAVIGSDTLAVAPTTVKEPGPGATAAARFTVQLGAAQPQPVSVNYTTADGTATAAHGDYTPTSGTLTIPAGQQTGEVDVPVTGDGLYGTSNKAFSLVLSSPVGADLAQPSAGAKILQDDPPPSISVSDAYVVRGTDPASGPQAAFTLALNAPSTAPVRVTYTTVNGTAVAGTDFTAVGPATVTIPAGSTTAQIAVPTFGVAGPAATQTFRVQLSAPSGAVIQDGSGIGSLLVGQGPAQLQIQNATAPAGGNGTVSFPVLLSAALTKPVTVSYATVDGTAKAGVDYTATSGQLTLPAGSTTGSVDVPVVPTASTVNHTFSVNLSAPTNATLTDTSATGTLVGATAPPPAAYVSDAYVDRGTDPSSGPAAAFTVSLSRPAAAATSVTVATANSTAVAGVDYVSMAAQQVSFAPGQTSQVVNVATLGASTPEPLLNFKVSLSKPVGVTLGDSSGVGYLVPHLGYVSGGIVNASGYEPASGSATIALPVVLAAATDRAVTVKYQTVDGTAHAASGDYTATSGTLTIPAGTTTTWIPVSIGAGTTPGTNRTFTVSLSSPTNVTLTTTTATATIVNPN